MKRLFLFLAACATSWWGYGKLRRHPKTAGKVAEFERQSQRIVDQATDSLRSAKDQAVGKAADIADTASAGATEAIDTAASKAHEALDTAAQKTRQVISPVQEKVSEIRGNLSATATEPGAEQPAG